jgi:ElaB/YqjD/DUF883 family membrane-anchored ribosome-binding protein
MNKAMEANSERARAGEPAELREHMRMIGDDVKELARVAKDALAQKVESAKGATADLYSRGHDKVVEYKDHFVDLARENPIRSVLIAAGVGAVVGLLLRRR